MINKLKYFLILIPIFLIISCTDNSMYLDEQEDAIEKRGESDVCASNCILDAQACYDWAEHLRDGHLLSCEYILIIGTELVDVYCTRQVVGWIDRVPVYSPEGELIRYDEVIHYIDEEYVCGQEEQNIISNDPADLQEYLACKAQALAEFVEAIDKCDIKRAGCVKKCKKGPLDEV